MLKKLLFSLIVMAVVVGFGKAVVYGIDKTIQIDNNTYYDHELGRMVYAEPGV